MYARTSVIGAAEAQKTIRALMMPPIERRQLLRKVGRVVTTKTRQRLRSQTGLDGQPWTPRKRRSARKMLRGVGKTLRMRPGDFTVSVGPTNPVANRIASAQQRGTSERMTATRMAAIHRKNDDKPATKRQAKALQDEGFKVKQPGTDTGKGWRKASQKWITANLTRRRAGLILRILRDSQTKQSWLLPLEPRTYLGATAQDVSTISDIIFSGTRA